MWLSSLRCITVCAGILVLSCVFGLTGSALAQVNDVALQGIVYSVRAEAIEGAVVEVGDQTAVTDQDGRFAITGISKRSSYDFTVTAEGYHQLMGQIDAKTVDLSDVHLFIDPLNNLICNGTFEDSEGGGPRFDQNGIGRYWEVICGGEHPEVYSLDKEIFHSGGTSQRMDCVGYLIDWSKGEKCYSLDENGEKVFHPVPMRLGFQAVAQMSDYSSIEPGKTYELTAWVKSENVEASWQWLRLELYWMTNSNRVLRVISQENTGHEPTHDWKLIKIRVVAPEKPGSVNEMRHWEPPQRAKVYLHHHFEQGTIWFDNVCLVQVD